MRSAIAVVLFAALLNTPAKAEVKIVYPVSVPQECFELAQREGVPVIIRSRYEAAKARLKLARLSGKDPLVQQCRAAVERMRQAIVQASRHVD